MSSGVRKRAQKLQTAHVDQWHGIRTEQETENVRASVARAIAATPRGTPIEDANEPDVLDTDRRLDGRPLTTYAQFIAELESGKADAGVVRAAVNLTTLMGGGARFHLNEAQGRAASKFRHLYQQSQVGGSRAIDPSVEAVDGGYRNPEAIFEVGADARREFIRTQSFLGPKDFRCAEYVIIGEHGPTSYARFRLRGERPNNGQLTAKFSVEFRGIMDRLAVYWQLQTRNAA